MKKLKFSLWIYLILFIGTLFRIYYLSDYSFDLSSADSTSRALITYDLFNSSEHYLPSTIWLPFYFYLYQLPLVFVNNISSILFFQFVLTCMNLGLYYLVLKKYFSENITKYSMIIAALLPGSLAMTSSANSTVSFTFFILLGILLDHPYKKKI